MFRLTSKIWRFLATKSQPVSRKKSRPSRRLELEPLEERALLDGNASGIVTGVAFIDQNSNGTFDAQEVIVPGVTINLTGSTDQNLPVSASAVTGADGSYLIDNVLPGNYQLSAAPNATVLGMSGPNLSAPFAVAGGQTVNRDFAVRGLAPAVISMRLFLTSTTDENLPFVPGSGSGLANPRGNNLPIVETAIPDVTAGKNSADTIIDLAGHFSDPDFSNSQIRFITSAGAINVQLFDGQAPQTVANFFNYINSNRYDNSIFHRLVPGFVLQGGGFNFVANPASLPAIPTDPTVENEFGASNTTGTIAMAKVDGDPNSATSQFFFNLANNGGAPNNLDTTNGGFTVFGRIVSPSDQLVLNALAALPVANPPVAAPPLNQLPLVNYTGTNFPTDTVASNYAIITDVEVVRRDEFLTYTLVSNTNPDLVEATIENNRLRLNYATEAVGAAVITVRATDRFGVSVETSFDVTVQNEPPVAAVTLTPDPAETNDTLTANVTASDPNGDPITFTYNWTVNGEVVKTITTTETTDTLDLSVLGNGDKGQVVAVEVIPSDGLLTGAAVEDSLTVANSAPVASVSITPETPTVTDILTATVVANDDDGDTMTINYIWSVNNVIVHSTPNSTSLTDTFDISAFAEPGDVVHVEVTANDGTVNGAAATDTVIVI
ncbi:MAG: peptidylprolyl isomerase [Gemmataceae bacterium]|nr:peptidylprolyl isomerase [Gemmataceae bacterium]MCI0739489.1 peptidylprolyl isomerase [Gemmataceae bacterium]